MNTTILGKLGRFTKQMTFSSRANFSTSTGKNKTGVYLWSKMPRLGPKTGAVGNQLSMPKGNPKRIEEFDDLNVKTIRVGMRHSAVVSQDGKLYTFGNGNWGVLGHGNENNVKFTHPRQVEALAKKKVVDVSLGEWHSMALTDDGNVYTWGYAGKKGYFNWMYSQDVGALGHGDKEAIFVPKKVQWFADRDLKVKSIAAGNFHSVAICDDGNMYTWGRGQYGVLGNGDNSYSLEPMLNEEFAFLKNEAKEEGTEFGFKKIDAANDYTACVTNDGHIYVFGKNDFGQLGVGSGIGIDLVESEALPNDLDLRKCLPEGTPEDDIPFVVDVHAGMRTMLVMDNKQRIYQTGLKIDWAPKLVSLNQSKINGKIEQINCGRGHYAFIDSENCIHCFGSLFKNTDTEFHDGYHVYYGDDLFDGNKIIEISAKYETFGAVVQDKQ